MKYTLSALLLLAAVSCASKYQVSPTQSAKQIEGHWGHALPIDTPPGNTIAKAVLRYATGLLSGDMSALKTSATSHYIQRCGGEERLQMKLEAKKPNYTGTTVHDLKLFETMPTRVMARYSVVFPTGEIDEMSDRWLVVIQEADGSWKVDDVDKEFSPFPLRFY